MDRLWRGVDNYYEQWDVPSPNTGFTAIPRGLITSLGLKTDGSIVAWGAGESVETDYSNHGQSVVPSPNTGFVAIAAGGYHSLGLKSDGSILGWGGNDPGRVMYLRRIRDLSRLRQEIS